ncbi:Isoquinoline 1-oxidoreductase subunit beta [Usitatibacter rugosus]|uniref:Isoquinoline 1-oxidoreductase subunit beta n=1 Tax=Usitatibacter rugosus TaxID=2732067 RepID=A0A6M4GVA1_9PROT|nr:molybdopterin cofactor-binding domain-containing protein [Usitatibacter rugosus]QJR11096.1 Isoquinoline 1-oxidoreductase subunit beta [Usitatibacter rugosus]
MNVTRRQFLVTSAAAGGGLALGLHVPFSAEAKSAAATEVNLWVAIRPDDTCVIRIARAEMGQGTLTGLAQLVAEELECDWSKVTTEGVTPGRNLAAKRAWGEMGTGGSRGIRTSHEYVRQGGAAARIMLLQAAADEWKVPVSELTVENGVITHAGSKKKTTYGKVAAKAAKLTPPDVKTIKLKDPKSWKVAGQGLNRLDTRDKLDGSKVYSIDVKLPGMLNAAIKQCPVFGGKLVSYDAVAIAGMPGVKGAVKVDNATVAVVADTWWHAKKALDALPITWDEGPNAKVNSAGIAAHLKSGIEAEKAFVGWKEGDAPKTLAASAKRVEAIYGTPFLAHSTMEPMNCTAKVSAEGVDVWVPTQNAEASLAAAAEAAGVPLEKCEIHRTDLGCGFGRRGGNQDYTKQAVSIAKQFPGVPIKMIWSREEDTTHDFYRPISQCKLSAGLDEAGNLTALQIRVSGQSINAWVNPNFDPEGKDQRQLQGIWQAAGDAQFGYTVPNLQVEYAMRNTHVPVGPWRGVNTNQNGVYTECFMDEVAKAAGKDPLEFRRALMSKHPKHLAVLNAAAEKAGWGTPLPPGVHRGIAQFMGYGSYSAAVAEVSVSPAGELKVHRMVLALNCGHAVNPAQIAAQVEGSVAYGLSATLYGENTVENGRIVEDNFHTYPILKLAEMPKVDTVIVPTYDFWGGVGEPTICVVAPAVLNAIHAATGKPVRQLPLKNQKLV